MVIFPLAPDQTIAQMWSNGARGDVAMLKPEGEYIYAFLDFSRGKGKGSGMFECLYVFTCLMTYLMQLTHQNVTDCYLPEGATLTISITLD